MTRIYFHTRERAVGVSGVERVHFGNLINDIALAFLRPRQFDKTLQEIAPPWTRYTSGGPFHQKFTTYWRTVHNEPLTLPDGRQVDPFTASLNTVLALGSLPLSLATRIHGQCELHGFVESHNVGWFRGLVETSLASGVFRSGEGWRDLVEMIDRQWPSLVPSPIVMSYSVCGSFPNPEIAGWLDGRDNDDRIYEEFGDLPDEQQWLLAMRGLRRRDKTYRLEMKPDNWTSYRFGDGMTAMELREVVRRT